MPNTNTNQQYFSLFADMRLSETERTLAINHYKTRLQQSGYSESLAEFIINRVDPAFAYGNWISLHNFLDDIHASYHHHTQTQGAVKFIPTHAQASKIAAFLDRENVMQVIGVLPNYLEAIKSQHLTVDTVLNLITAGHIEHIKLIMTMLNELQSILNSSQMNKIFRQSNSKEIFQFFIQHKTQLNPLFIDILVDTTCNRGLEEAASLLERLANVDIDRCSTNEAALSDAEDHLIYDYLKQSTRRPFGKLRSTICRREQLVKTLHQQDEACVQKILNILVDCGHLIDVDGDVIKVSLEGIKSLLNISASQRKLCGLIDFRRVSKDAGNFRMTGDLLSQYLARVNPKEVYCQQIIRILIQPEAGTQLINKNRIKTSIPTGKELLGIACSIRKSVGLSEANLVSELHAYYFTIKDPLLTAYKNYMATQTQSTTAEISTTFASPIPMTSEDSSFARFEGLFACDDLPSPILYRDTDLENNEENSTQFPPDLG